MAEMFEQGKHYVFSKDKWLTGTGNVLLYQGNPYLRQMVDNAHGRETEAIEGYNKCRSVDGFITKPEYCEELKFNQRIVLGEDVKVTKSKGAST